MHLHTRKYAHALYLISSSSILFSIYLPIETDFCVLLSVHVDCLCVCVCVCVYRSKKIFWASTFKNSTKMWLHCYVKCIAEELETRQGGASSLWTQATHTHTHTHTHKYTGVCILMLCIQQLECGGISGGMKCLNQLCLLITDHADCWVVHGCDKLMYFIHLSYVCI